MPQKRRKMNVTVQLPQELWARFKLIAGETGASLNYCLERVINDVVGQGSIPGLGALNAHESRENAKYGPPTPVYDGPQDKPPKAAQLGRKRHVESSGA